MHTRVHFFPSRERTSTGAPALRSRVNSRCKNFGRRTRWRTTWRSTSRKCRSGQKVRTAHIHSHVSTTLASHACFRLLPCTEEATEYFESGGEVVPGAGPPAPEPLAKMARPSDETIKKWFPKWKPATGCKFRMLCFHNAGSAESVYTGKGMRQKEDNPFVKYCESKGGELMACELPGRESRRNEPRHTVLSKYVEALFPVIAPLLQEDVRLMMIPTHAPAYLNAEGRGSRISFPCGCRCRTWSSATRWARG